ncbi:hypothetical protein PPL_08898 [Heterostelium album PN500]|uniref:Uncharacterized protein n=1 Tax=Heterostelium pallidum (strain ATCC 26659 / Pp 5 / PN500) TaxID=670386 RepID=D3BK17_HETP5|nr:hypothetical protein PPL_08898 [Heterostelium album PN500]EFA78247.1 hypothetical protein PPL_08898 [Heterostelium album PN500]|eukprot:XP_020430372.1 hypothetical protein PPL_08898 [Heterostelium album PN500]
MNSCKIKQSHESKQKSSRGFFGFETLYPKGMNPALLPPPEFEEMIRNINGQSRTTYPKFSFCGFIGFFISIIFIFVGFIKEIPALYIIGFILIVGSISSLIGIQISFRRRLMSRMEHAINDANTRLQPRGMKIHIREKLKKHHHHTGSHQKRRQRKIYLELEYPIAIETAVIYQVAPLSYQPQQPGVYPVQYQPGYPPAQQYPYDMSQQQQQQQQQQPIQYQAPYNTNYQTGPPTQSNGELPYIPQGYQQPSSPPTLTKPSDEF